MWGFFEHHNILGEVGNNGKATGHKAIVGKHANSSHGGHPPHPHASHGNLAPPRAHLFLRHHHCYGHLAPSRHPPLASQRTWASLTNPLVGTTHLPCLPSPWLHCLGIWSKMTWLVSPTFQRPHVWEDTHFMALVAFAMTNGVTLCSCSCHRECGKLHCLLPCSAPPTALSTLYSYLIREDQYQYIIRWSTPISIICRKKVKSSVHTGFHPCSL